MWRRLHGAPPQLRTAVGVGGAGTFASPPGGQLWAGRGFLVDAAADRSQVALATWPELTCAKWWSGREGDSKLCRREACGRSGAFGCAGVRTQPGPGLGPTSFVLSHPALRTGRDAALCGRTGMLGRCAAASHMVSVVTGNVCGTAAQKGMPGAACAAVAGSSAAGLS